VKSVIQRVKNASVSVSGEITGYIKWGLLVYLGVAAGDTEKDAERLAEKTVNLRIFEDIAGKMNLSLLDVLSGSKKSQENSDSQAGIGVLAVSQFTLLADTRRGRRPYYGEAAAPDKAKELYEYFLNKLKEQGLLCEAGVFQAHMEISYTNDGPVTILLDS
jgi:D-tyrosyl-tRNA(Tyr) deacylase